MPTYKFHDSLPEPKKTVKPHHVKPIASPQRAPVPKLFSQPTPTEARVPDAQQPYADDQQSPYGEPYQNPYQADGKSISFYFSKGNVRQENFNEIDHIIFYSFFLHDPATASCRNAATVLPLRRCSTESHGE